MSTSTCPQARRSHTTPDGLSAFNVRKAEGTATTKGESVSLSVAVTHAAEGFRVESRPPTFPVAVSETVESPATTFTNERPLEAPPDKEAAFKGGLRIGAERDG